MNARSSVVSDVAFAFFFFFFLSVVLHKATELRPGPDRARARVACPPRGWYSKYGRNVDQLTAGRVETGWGR